MWLRIGDASLASLSIYVTNRFSTRNAWDKWDASFPFPMLCIHDICSAYQCPSIWDAWGQHIPPYFLSNLPKDIPIPHSYPLAPHHCRLTPQFLNCWTRMIVIFHPPQWNNPTFGWWAPIQPPSSQYSISCLIGLSGLISKLSSSDPICLMLISHLLQLHEELPMPHQLTYLCSQHIFI